MKKQIILGISMLGVLFIVMVCLFISQGNRSAKAQENIEDREARKKEALEIEERAKAGRERDKTIPQETVNKVIKEGSDLLDKIVQEMKEKKPKWTLKKRLGHLGDYGLGRLGSTSGELSWRKDGGSLWIGIDLVLSKAEEPVNFRRGNNSIAGGYIEEVKGIGDEAIFVKNGGGLIDTSVGLYFVKSRAEVNLNITNRSKTTARNEKEIREIAKIIAPLIVVRDNFDQ